MPATGEPEKPGRLRTLWLRLRGGSLGADAKADDDSAQSVRDRLAAIEQQGRDDQAHAFAVWERVRAAIGSADSSLDQLGREWFRFERTRPTGGGGALPAGAAEAWALAALAELQEGEVVLERQKQERASAEDWRRRAQLSVRAGDDDLARESLNRVREHELAADALGRELEVSRKVAAELRSALLAISKLAATPIGPPLAARPLAALRRLDTAPLALLVALALPAGALAGFALVANPLTLRLAGFAFLLLAASLLALTGRPVTLPAGRPSRDAKPSAMP